MALTTAQKATLKAAILADSTLNAYTNNSDGNFDMCVQKLNVDAVPSFTVWRNMVSLSEVGRKFDSAELGNRSTADNTRLQTIAQYNPSGINPSVASNRAFFDDIFSGVGGANTRVSLLATWKRLAKLGEKILATGTGSDAVPATLGFEGNLTPDDVQQARSS